MLAFDQYLSPDLKDYHRALRYVFETVGDDAEVEQFVGEFELAVPIVPTHRDLAQHPELRALSPHIIAWERKYDGYPELRGKFKEVILDYDAKWEGSCYEMSGAGVCVHIEDMSPIHDAGSCACRAVCEFSRLRSTRTSKSTYAMSPCRPSGPWGWIRTPALTCVSIGL